MHSEESYPNVHTMNNSSDKNQDDMRSFLLMSELENGEPITQREIAGRCGIALGLVNAYLKSLVQKGFVTVKSYPRNRYAYLLTPNGFAEKSRLAFQHLNNFNKLYRATRQDSLQLFLRLREDGISSVSFCGLDDLTEIAFLSVQEANLKLATVMDQSPAETFLNTKVISLEDGIKVESGGIVITSIQRAEQLKEALLNLGVEKGHIHSPSRSFEEVIK